MKVRTTSVILIVNVLSIALAGTVQGRPSYATTRNNNCFECHTTMVTGRMEVTAEDSLTDLGTQLDGNVRSALKTFKVLPGQVVTLSVRVLDGNDRFAVQLKDFEKPARRSNASNLLIWSPANDADNIWNRQEVSNPPYFTKNISPNSGISGSISPITYTFDLLVESGTPVDIYELVFAVPGRRSGVRVYQEEHFYIEVLSPYDLNLDGIVDGADISLMVDHWHTDEPLYDIAPEPFGDGIVDVQDLIVLAEHLFEDYRMVAHWKLDEQQDDIAQDSVRDKDGTLNGEPIWQPDGGIVDGALQLDGIDDYVSTPFVLNPAYGKFSVFAWIKGGAAGQVVVSQQGAANWLTVDVEGNLMTELKGADRSAGPLQSQTIITDGNWHRVGFVWDGANRILYVDDVAVVEDTQDGLESSEGGLYIGTGKAMEAGTYFSGLIDDIRFYDRVIKP